MGGTTGKVVIGLIMIAVLMIMFPLVMTATHDLQTDDQVDADLAITTDDVTLTVSLWKAEVASVLSIVGNGTEEAGAITAASYVEATKVLTLAGVTDSTTATVTYEMDGLTDYTGMGTLVGITPLLIWIAILAAVLGGIWFSVKGRG